VEKAALREGAGAAYILGAKLITDLNRCRGVSCTGTARSARRKLAWWKITGFVKRVFSELVPLKGHTDSTYHRERKDGCEDGDNQAG